MPRKPNTASPKKAPKMRVVKPKRKKTTSDHPSYRDMIIDAINTLRERSGSSHSAIMKFVTGKFQIPPEKAKTHVKIALRKMVDEDTLLRVKASFKLADGTKNRLKKEAQVHKKKEKGAEKKQKDLQKQKAVDKKQKDKEKEKKQKEKEKEKEKKQKEKEKKQKEKSAKKESPKKRKAAEVSRSPRKSTRDSTRKSVERSLSPPKKRAKSGARTATKRTTKSK